MAALVAVNTYAGPAATETACFDVKGMTCASCGVTLKAAVRKLKGISSVEVFVQQGSAKVVFDPGQTNKNAIKNKIDDVGYLATVKDCKS